MDWRSPYLLKKQSTEQTTVCLFPQEVCETVYRDGCRRIQETHIFNALPWPLFGAQSSGFLVLPPFPPVLLMETSFSGIRFKAVVPSASFPSSLRPAPNSCCFSPCTFFSISSSHHYHPSLVPQSSCTWPLLTPIHPRHYCQTL